LLRETVTSLTSELFCLDSRDNFAGAPVNYDLKKHRASAFAVIWRACRRLGKKFRRNLMIVPFAASAD
jgi:hypothetical protein